MNRSAAYKKQTLSHKLELSTHHHSSNEPYKKLVAIGTDSISRCKSYYQMIDAIMTKSMVNINLEYIKSIYLKNVTCPYKIFLVSNGFFLQIIHPE